MTEDSVINHEFLRHRAEAFMEDIEFRVVLFVEIMLPCMSRGFLERNLWTFDLNHSGYGIDMMWGEGIVIDRFQVRHARPQQMVKIAEDRGWPHPQEEFKVIRERYL